MANDDKPMPSLEELQRKIDAVHPGRTSSEDSNSSVQYGKGMRMGIDLLAGAGVGLAIGYYVDKAFDTAPIFLIVFLFVGFAAGLRNIMRNVDKV